MKNIKFIFAALVSLAALSCGKLESPVSNSETNQDSGLVTLTLSTGEQTKTHISNVTTNGVTEIHWDEGDKIKVFTNEEYLNSNAFSFSMSETPSDNFAKFSGSIAKGTEYIWAVYPESSAKSCSDDGNGSDIVASLPSEQRPVAKSFDTNLNISVAKSKVTKNGSFGKYELAEVIFVNFKNVCSLLKFTAPDNAAQISSVTLTANENIVGDMTIDYSGDAPVFKSIANGSNTITMTGSFEAGKDYYFVVAPVNITGISMTIQANGETRYITNATATSLQPGVVKSLGTVKMSKMTKISAGAEHQYSNNKVLNGTNVNFDLGNAGASSISLTIKKTDNTATRSAAALVSAYSSDSNWPYLPQGEYTFSGSFSVNGVNVTVPATSFSVPAPVFTVNNFTAFTSYSKYIDKKTSVANDLDGSSIYKTVTVNIANSILNGSNYKSMIKVDDVAYSPETKDGEVCVKFGGKEWKQHVVSQIKWTFDNVSVTKKLEAAQTVNVTGIPKRVTLYSNESEAKTSGWSFNNVKWEAGKCIIFYNGDNGNMISPEFYVPQNININCSYGAQYYVGFISLSGLDVSDFSAQVRVGLTSDNSNVSTSYTEHQLNASKNPGESFYQFTDQFTLTSTLRYISCHHNSPDRPTKKGLIKTQKANYWYINLQKVNIEYR